MIRVVLGGVFNSPPPTKRKYREYSPSTLTKAYETVIEGDLSVRKASKMYGVPMQTLRDRVIGHVHPDVTRSGPGPLFSQLEEARLVEHIKAMAKVGYPYTRAEVINTASEFACALEKKGRKKALSYKWFYAFTGRWPELKVQRPKTVSELRLKATSYESIATYFNELEKILIKYNLKDSPESIYNVDEKGVQQNFKPGYVVGSRDCATAVACSERSMTTTILGCGNALGHQIPPYFVFAGARMREELLEGACHGAKGTITKSGWSNGAVFMKYLEEHFINYATSKRPLLLLYDGHLSHVSPCVIDWAVSHSIILYVLPPHTSHILQPMDVGCFGPFAKIYSNECMKHQRSTGKVVDRYSVCSIACKAYISALSVQNLQSAFKKSGIFPFNPEVVDPVLMETNQLRSDWQAEEAIDTHLSDNDSVGESEILTAVPLVQEPEILTAVPLVQEPEILAAVPLVQEPEILTAVPLVQVPEILTAVPLVQEPEILTTVSIAESNTTDTPECANSELVSNFFKKRRPVFKPPIKSERRSISKIVAGKAITEEATANKVREYVAKSKPKVPLAKSKAKKSSCWSVPIKSKSPRPSTSGLAHSGGPIDLDSPVLTEDCDDDDDDDDGDDELCCVCNKFQPAEFANCQSVVFVKWAQCDICQHWTHLIFCTQVRVIRRGDVFKCPHCEKM